jgi:hypothetical protein
VCAAVAAAHLCKFTAVLLWPMMGAMAVPLILGRERNTRRKIVRGWLGAVGLTLLALNAAYGFRGTFAPLSSMHLYSSFLQSLEHRLPDGFPSPLPRTLLEGFDAQKLDTESGYQGFLFGHVYEGSHWWYYPAALACKLPVSVLLLAGAAVISLASAGGRRRAPDGAGEWSLVGAALVYVAGVIVLSDVNIGTRYLLPAFPLAMILISRLWLAPVGAAGAPRPPAIARNALVAIMALEMLWTCPRFLSFINFAAGGSDYGGRLVSVSDFDWGQGLIDLRHWMDDHKVPSVTLAYFGLIDPHVYGVQFSTLDHPGDERYVAISSYYLSGMRNRMVIGPNQRERIQLPRGKELWSRQPVAIVGHTIFIFERKDVADVFEIGNPK